MLFTGPAHKCRLEKALHCNIKLQLMNPCQGLFVLELVSVFCAVKTGVLSRMTTLPSATVADADSFLPTGVDYLALDHSNCPPQ
uniref:Uncharacterized protein n=1 Tax=Timema poppense TaxID=170557 RepID=A0A7R9HIF4_TIMPO|nr:unnamed protein product [Timema poppensis]